MDKVYCEICKEKTRFSANRFQFHLDQEHNGISVKDYYDRFLKKPEEGKCKTCGKETKYQGICKGYSEYHRGCISKSKLVQRKKEKTKLKNFGDKNYNNRDKYRKSCMEKFGVENPFQNEEVKNKSKKTFNDKYGVDNYGKTVKSKERWAKRTFEKVIDVIENFDIDFESADLNKDGKVSLKCSKGHEFSQRPNFLYYLDRRDVNEICPLCYKEKGLDKDCYFEKQLFQFVNETYEGEVQRGVRGILDKKELDVYIPDLKLAFEFNGIYWHNELNKDKNYHLNKTEECESKGIHLIHIWEDDWVVKRNIVESRISSLLNKTKEKLFARKCVVKEIENRPYKKFLEENHIQGYVSARVKLGLYHGDELVSVMSFGSLRKNLGRKSEEGKFELLRFCSKLNYNVVGSANKMFKFFINTYRAVQVLSYADRSWSSLLKGTVYDNLGFKMVGKTKPNYWYVHKHVRRNRFNYTKAKLVKEGFSEKLSEKQIMNSRKIYRIFDSGSLKYIINLDVI